MSIVNSCRLEDPGQGSRLYVRQGPGARAGRGKANNMAPLNFFGIRQGWKTCMRGRAEFADFLCEIFMRVENGVC